MKKLRIMSFFLALLLVLTFCACQAAEAPETPDTPDAPDSATTPETPDAPPASDAATLPAPEQPIKGEPDDADVPEETPDAPTEPTGESPVIEPFTGTWTQKTDKTEDTIVIDDGGEIAVLTAQLPLRNVQLERVALLVGCGSTYESCFETYTVQETLHTIESLAAGDTFRVQLELGASTPEYAVSWEDEFGERERRLLLTSKLYSDGKADETLQLIRHSEKIMPVEITAGLDLHAASELTAAEDYTGGETAWGTTVTQTEILTQYHYDIDGNGRKNSIQLLRLTDEFDQIFYGMRVVCGEVFFDADVALPYVSGLWMADLNADGCAELYLCGDMASDDYMTYGWTLGENGLEHVLFCGNIRSGEYDKAAPRIDGEILSIENQAIRLESYVHRLGSHFVWQDYTAEADGTLSPAPGQNWTCDDGHMVTVQRELPVTTDGTQDTLPAGTRLTVTAVDAGTRAYFRTDGGVSGYVTLEEGSYFGAWNIDGIADTEYFDNLIYAG